MQTRPSTSRRSLIGFVLKKGGGGGILGGVKASFFRRGAGPTAQQVCLLLCEPLNICVCVCVCCEFTQAAGAGLMMTIDFRPRFAAPRRQLNSALASS